MEYKNKMSNFLFSVIIYFIIMSAIVVVLHYITNLHPLSGFVIFRGILAIYLASVKRIKIFKEQ